jgi:hypothetical protein
VTADPAGERLPLTALLSQVRPPREAAAAAGRPAALPRRVAVIDRCAPDAAALSAGAAPRRVPRRQLTWPGSASAGHGEVVEPRTDLVGAGMVQVIEDGERLLPGLARRRAVAEGAVRVAEPGQHPGLL